MHLVENYRSRRGLYFSSMLLTTAGLAIILANAHIQVLLANQQNQDSCLNRLILVTVQSSTTGNDFTCKCWSVLQVLVFVR